MKTLTALPLAATLTATSLTGSPAQASGFEGTRWDPCAPITVHVDGHGGYAGSVRDFQHAVQVVARVSGLPISEVSSSDADISVRWTRPARNPHRQGAVVAATSTLSIEHDGVNETVGAWIDLDRGAGLRHGFPTSGAPGWGQVYLHELGHAIGLAHVRGRDQVMNAVQSSANHVLGSGDRTRFRAVGSARGCIVDSVR